MMLLLAAPALSIAEPPGVGDAFTFDISKYTKTDPALRRWSETGTLGGTLPALAGIAAMPDGGFLVVGGRDVLSLAPDGAVRWKTSMEEDGRCVALAPDGRILVGTRRYIEVLDTAGKSMGSWPDLGEEAVITSVSASTGSVFIADAGQRTVWRFDPGGRLLGRLGDKDRARGIDGFIVPSPHLDVIADDDGSVWVTNPGWLRLEHYAADGRPLSRWGEAGFDIENFCGCCNPTDIARLPGGAFVTAEKGIPRVKTCDASGRFTGVVAGAEDFDEDTAGIDVAVDTRGRVLVADPKRRVIRVFEPRGEARP
jgi:hypothetical protein